MKKLLLLTIIALLSFFSIQGLAEDSEVYYCDEIQHLAIEQDTVKSYKLDRFKFKKENDFITLTGSSFGSVDEFYEFTKLDVQDDYKGKIFAISFEHSMNYNRDNGAFQYSHLMPEQIHIIIAKCEIF